MMNIITYINIAAGKFRKVVMGCIRFCGCGTRQFILCTINNPTFKKPQRKKSLIGRYPIINNQFNEFQRIQRKMLVVKIGL